MVLKLLIVKWMLRLVSFLSSIFVCVGLCISRFLVILSMMWCGLMFVSVIVLCMFCVKCGLWNCCGDMLIVMYCSVSFWLF